MLENFYLVAKSIAALIFFVIAIVLIALSIKASSYKKALAEGEQEIKKQLPNALNMGSAAITLLFELFVHKGREKTPFWLSALGMSPLKSKLGKYQTFYNPVKSILESCFDIKERAKHIKN